MDINQIGLLVKSVLKYAGLYSDEAFYLLMGTGAQESGYKYLSQLGDGPARSFWQVEPATAYDNFRNYLCFRPKILQRIIETCHLSKNRMERVMQWPEGQARSVLGELLEINIAFAILMARIRYYRVPESIPSGLDGMAAYWKRHYNTEFGAGTVEEFKRNYSKYKIMEAQ